MKTIAVPLGLSSSTITEANPFGLGWGKQQQKVVELFAQYYDQGARTFLRHRPHGEILGGPMDIDAGAEIAYDRDWKYILDDYDTSTEWFASRCPDAKIIDYLGTIEGDLTQRLDEGRYSSLIHRLWMSVRRLTDHPNVWMRQVVGGT